MKRVSTTLAVAFASMLMAVGCGSNDSAIKEATTTTTITESTTSTSTTTSTTTVPLTTTTTVIEETTVAPQETPVEVTGMCKQWYDLAMRVGWPQEEWPMLDRVMYRESRCNIDSFNQNDVNGGSRGLMQVNGYWCLPNKWTQAGWLQDRDILETCGDLFDPETNLRAALAMFMYSSVRNGNGWHPWRM